jgi:hypothetical protein
MCELRQLKQSCAARATSGALHACQQLAEVDVHCSLASCLAAAQSAGQAVIIAPLPSMGCGDTHAP